MQRRLNPELLSFFVRDNMPSLSDQFGSQRVVVAAYFLLSVGKTATTRQGPSPSPLDE